MNTVPAAKLTALSTEELIAQYDLAISSQRGRYSNCAPRQKRIDKICDIILSRSEKDDDPVANHWLDSA